MRAVLAFLCAGLALECCGGEWVAWPAGEAVPEGWSRKVDATTGGVYVDVNATVLASLESMERRWRESVEWMAGQGVTELVELGAGAVLGGLTKRIVSDVTAQSVGTADGLKGFAESLR